MSEKPDAQQSAPETAAPPVGVPEKFWDPQTKEVRVEALLKAYTELEKLLGRRAETVPASPEDYDPPASQFLTEVPPEVLARLHAAGFSKAQAELVWQLADEFLEPIVEDVTGAYVRRAEIEKLTQRFGGEDNWNETARQLATWGKAHLSPEIYAALAASAQGVIALHRMMCHEEPDLMNADGAAGSIANEQELRKLMNDPRYWRDAEPGLVSKVRRGFERLFPDGGS